jgi:hypothetical protein
MKNGKRCLPTIAHGNPQVYKSAFLTKSKKTKKNNLRPWVFRMCCFSARKENMFVVCYKSVKNPQPALHFLKSTSCIAGVQMCWGEPRSDFRRGGVPPVLV